MKHSLFTIVIVLCSFTITKSQGKSPTFSGNGNKEVSVASAKPETIRLDLPAQQELAELQRQTSEAKAVLDAAAARYDAAQQKVVTAVFKAMADLGLKPKEWTIKPDQSGGIYFEKLKTAESASTIFPTKN